MRRAVEVLEDLLILMELTELGERIAPKGRERWAIDCAQRAVGANVDRCGEQLPALREGLAAARRWLKQPPERDEHHATSALVLAARKGLGKRAQEATKGNRLAMQRTVKAADAVIAALDSVAAGANMEQVAAVAREAFPEDADEATAQAMRLLYWTKMLPSGQELLVRLDYAESLGRLPSDGEQRAWIEAQRGLLMTDDEAGRMAMVLRHADLVFLAELDRIR
jgi:hypothetical protein